MGDEEKEKSRSALTVGSRTKSLAAFGSKSVSRMKVRKASYGFGGVPGIRPVERTSQLGIEFKRPPLLYLNTYQLEPANLFHVARVTQVVNEMLDEAFTGHKYNAQESPGIAIRLAGDVMRKLKTMDFPRYRFITVVTLGQKRSQSVNNAISFIWDHERDNYVDVHREVTTAYIQVTAFAGLEEEERARRVILARNVRKLTS